MTCARSGLEFEATSTRQKVHPEVRSMLDEANKRGVYREFSDELKADGSLSIADLKELLSAAINKSKQEMTEIRSRAERERERRKLNAWLRQHGYRWQYEDGESLDAFSPDGAGLEHQMGWQLIAPNGRSVTVEQAKAEIKLKA